MMEAKPTSTSSVQDNLKNNLVYVGLGANLDNPQQHITKAFDDLANITNTQLESYSSLYKTTPLGPAEQPDFINAVAKLSTKLAPTKFLKELQLIENQHGRIRKNERWGPRTLDLDLLLYNNDILLSQELTIPHYAIYERNFVLIPLYELSPNLILPNGHQLASLIKTINKQGIEKLC